MWKVKRMDTARILDLAIAIGAGSLAARPARGPDGKSTFKSPALRFFAPDARYPRSGRPSLAVTQR
jgi:hypothetical protein